MAINNAINRELPVDVVSSGTGATTLTDHGVLVGNGTNAVTALSVGTTGQLLVGVTASDPAFAASVDGNFTFTSATAGTNRTLTVSNTDNTSSSSAGTLQLTSGGSSAGDTTVKLQSNTSWSIGIDNSATDDPLSLSQNSALGTNVRMLFQTSGAITKPSQPAFLAYRSTNLDNQTGNGAVAALTMNAESYDQSSDFSSATFTAPVTGRYLLSSMTTIGDIVTAMTTGNLDFVISSSYVFKGFFINCGAVVAGTQLGFNQMAFVPMVAGDTAVAHITISNGVSDSCDIQTAASDGRVTNVCGVLIA